MFPNWDENTIMANGASLHYYRTPGGRDSGKPALVLQHGFSDNGLCWAPVAQELEGAYDIIMPDARGHGLSGRVQRGEVVDQAAALAALLGALGIEKAIVAGHSMGAQFAAMLGARFPELARALILEDPPWFLPPPGGENQPRGRMEDSPLGRWAMGLKDQTLEQIIDQCHTDHPTWPEPYVLAWCQGKKQLDQNFLAVEQRGRTPWQQDVAAIACPVLLVTADPALGGIVTPEAARIVTEKNPKVRVVNFPGVGHHVRFAVHDAYMQAFKAFLDEIESL